MLRYISMICALAICALAFALTRSTSTAYSQEAQKVFNNMANEMAECAAYFSILSVTMESSKKPADAVAWRNRSESALEQALIATNEAGLKEETVAAHYRMALDEMSKRIDKNTSNISMLMADYKTCASKL